MASAANTVGAPVVLKWTSASSEAAALAITNPDGTTVSPAPDVTTSASSHTADFEPTQAGRHVLTWTAAESGQVFVDVLDVWPVSPRYLISFEDAAERVGSKSNPGAIEKYDALPLYIASATWVIEESYTGPIIPQEKDWSEYFTRDRAAIVVPDYDITVTGVTVNGNELSSGDYRVDEGAGIVHAYGTRFYESVVVSYTAGSNVVSPPVRQACIEIVAHMWQSQRESNRTSAPSTDTVQTPIGFAIPRRAAELLATVPKPVSFA